MTTFRTGALALLIGLIMAMPGMAFAADGSFDDSSLSGVTRKVTLTGETDATKVRIVVENEDGKKVYTSRTIKVRDGEWRARISKNLKPGDYEVTLYDDSGKKRVELDTATLTVTSKNGSSKSSSKGGELAVSGVPLLMGGTANANTSVPVAYIKVTNKGKSDTSISGFNLVETGSAPDSVVTGFSTSDDKGGSRSTVSATFNKKGQAFVPLAATLAPGQFRIYTIKAVIGSNTSFGSQLRINVAGIETGAKTTAAFPIIGTTFTLGI
ncbi:MAG TPA: hypothetical protein VEB18_03945 [Candidatus Paceibacterota bacterium]|nr:hypothetical protein [Candidatus Paceibacterota bacterium]